LGGYLAIGIAFEFEKKNQTMLGLLVLDCEIGVSGGVQINMLPKRRENSSLRRVRDGRIVVKLPIDRLSRR
jgi:hypothetical protein